MNTTKIRMKNGRPTIVVGDENPVYEEQSKGNRNVKQGELYKIRFLFPRNILNSDLAKKLYETEISKEAFENLQEEGIGIIEGCFDKYIKEGRIDPTVLQHHSSYTPFLNQEGNRTGLLGGVSALVPGPKSEGGIKYAALNAHLSFGFDPNVFESGEPVIYRSQNIVYKKEFKTMNNLFNKWLKTVEKN